MSRSDLRDVWRSGQLQPELVRLLPGLLFDFGRRFRRRADRAPGNPETGAIGFSNWDVNSSAAQSIGGLNIIALGGEGSVSATSLTLTDDGSNTMLFASFDSDSLGGHDWQNLTTSICREHPAS